MTQIAAYPSILVEALVDWCGEHAQAKPSAVTCIGLALGHGLNEHQIAAATVQATGPPAQISIPLARRAAEIPTAARRTLALEAPSWVAESVGALLASQVRSGSLLFRTRSRVGIPRSPAWVRSTVSAAAVEATGYALTPTGLNRTRLALAAEEGHQLAPFHIGYARSWEVRLVDATVRPRLPHRA